MSPFGAKEKANWLFRGLIVLSLGLHLVVLLRIAGVYRLDVPAPIELTLQQVSPVSRRDIPRPPHQLPPPPPAKLVERLTAAKNPVPELKSLKAAQLEPARAFLPPGSAEAAGLPDVPVGDAPAIYPWAGGDGGAREPAPVETRSSYFERIRLRIEENKRYPEAAKSKRIEGRVTVSFTITLDGAIKDVAVVNKSGSRTLDEAALRAVKESSPFPKPPWGLFKGDTKLMVAVVFELT